MSSQQLPEKVTELLSARATVARLELEIAENLGLKSVAPAPVSVAKMPPAKLPHATGKRARRARQSYKIVVEMTKAGESSSAIAKKFKMGPQTIAKHRATARKNGDLPKI